jgi:hypothetical protein
VAFWRSSATRLKPAWGAGIESFLKIHLGKVAENSVWVFLGDVADKIAGVRSGVRLVSEKMRSHAERCLAYDQYNSMYLLRIGGSMRKDAVRCGGAKITFRVRCIQPGSATSPRYNSSFFNELMFGFA